MGFIDRVRSGKVVLEGDGVEGAGGFSSALLRKGMHIGQHSGSVLTMKPI
jgi:hypothetical protein